MISDTVKMVRALALGALLLAAGCAVEDTTDNDPPPDRADAGPIGPSPGPDAMAALPDAAPPEGGRPDTEGRSCQAGDPPCGEDTTCVNFGAHFGGQICEGSCAAHEDCPTECCSETDQGNNVCAPYVYCGQGGIVPELTAYAFSLCGGDEADWNGYLQGCLATRTSAEVQIWTSRMWDCLNNSTSCEALAACYRNVPYC